MIKIKDNKTLLRRISLVICFMLVLRFSNIGLKDVSADQLKSEPTFTVEIDPLTPNPAKIGEDITVTGKIKPQPFESNRQKKQIVLVLDVSYSMNGNKISNLKNAANNFITKMSDIPNTEIAIVAYSSEATINPTLIHHSLDGTGFAYNAKDSKSITERYSHKVPAYISSGSFFIPADNTNTPTLKAMVTNLEALGGTNAGEGLRKAEYMLKNGDEAANKSIVFMSDGLPTFHSVKETQANYNNIYTDYTTIDKTNPSYAGTGSDQDSNNVQKSKAYAITIGEIIKKQNVNVFSIGYGLGNETSTGNVIMQDIHKSMGGATGESGTFFATDENAIEGVFNKIADKIIEKYTLTDVKINFEKDLNFDSNFILNSGDKVVNIRNINYKTQNRTDGRIIYEAEEIPFTFTIKGNAIGTYDNVFNGAKFIVPYNGKELVTDMPKVGITITDNGLPIIKANIIGQTPDPATISQEITLKYEVNPESFEFNSTIFDKAGPKDVIFLIDTSNSMEDKLNSVKNGMFGKIVNNSEIKNAKYGIVTFNSAIKDDYISDGLTKDVNTLDSAIKEISCSNESIRNVGDAMEHAKTIFSDSGRSDSSKYIILIASDNIEYTTDQLIDIEKSNFNVITVNLGYITPPTKVNDKIIAGADEPNNNIKELHYNLIGKQDKGENILQKSDDNYFININYSKVTNQTDPNEFFTKEENINQMNNSNEVHNWVLPLVAEKLKNGTVQIKTPSYTFKTKLKFNLGGKFDSISGFNTCSDIDYDVETPEFDVKYNLVNGKYVPEKINLKYFTIKIKPDTEIKNLYFGPGIVSYTTLANKITSTIVNPYSINLKSSLAILEYGLYEGIINKEPSINDGSKQIFSLAKGANVNLGATMVGSINNNTGVRLEVPTEIEISNTIDVFTYDDYGELTQIGTMEKVSSDSIKTTYTYEGQEVLNSKILMLYKEKLPQNPTVDEYKNSLFVPDGQKDVKIRVTGESPELF